MAIKIEIRFYGTTQNPSAPKDFAINMKDGSSIKDVFEQVEKTLNLKIDRDEVNIIHNNNLVPIFGLDKRVEDDDRIVIMPLVGGG